MTLGCLRVSLEAAADIELAEDALWAAGATAISQQARDGTVELEAGFVNDETARRAGAAVGERFPGAGLTVVDPTAALDAALHAWKAHARPVRVGRVHVRYPWSDPGDEPPAAGECVVVLDPVLAFGSGSHPSTRACLSALDRLVQRGTSVLDIGCGSGVLAVAAAKLGASPVVAIDVDPGAVEATAANANRNGVDVRVSTEPVHELDVSFDLVVANIGAGTLVALADTIAARVAPGGTLVLAGLLEMQGDAVRAAYARHGIQLGDMAVDDGWVAHELRRASTTRRS